MELLLRCCHPSAIEVCKAMAHLWPAPGRLPSKRALKAEAETTYNNEIQQKLAQTVWQSGGCVSWYQNKSGKNIALWPGYTFTFMKRTKVFEPEKYEMVK